MNIYPKFRQLKFITHHIYLLFQNFQFSKVDFLDTLEDFPFSQNAGPLSAIPPAIKSYFSLSPDGKPLKTVLRPHETNSPKEEDWETDDYVIIPDRRILD